MYIKAEEICSLEFPLERAVDVTIWITGTLTRGKNAVICRKEVLIEGATGRRERIQKRR